MTTTPSTSNVLQPTVAPVTGNLIDLSSGYIQRGTVGSTANAFESFTDLGGWSFTAGHTTAAVSTFRFDIPISIPIGVELRITMDSFVVNSGAIDANAWFSVAQDVDWPFYSNEATKFRGNAWQTGFSEQRFTTVASGLHVMALQFATTSPTINFTMRNLRLEWL